MSINVAKTTPRFGNNFFGIIYIKCTFSAPSNSNENDDYANVWNVNDNGNVNNDNNLDENLGARPDSY